MTSLTRAVARALTGVPISLRALSRVASVSHAQLARIVAGDRRATPAVALAVASALETLSNDFTNAAAQIRRSANNQRRGGK